MNALRIVVAAFGTVLASAIPAQAPAPNPHWGASAYPRSRQELRGTISLNRFTEFDGEQRRYNDVDVSAGFNIASLQYNHEVLTRTGGRFTISFDAGAGYSDDQPTEALQNDYIHGIRNLVPVPTDGQRESPEYLAGVAVTRWFGSEELREGRDAAADDARWSAFAGGGMVASTLYHEAYAQLGGSLFVPGIATRLQLLNRSGLTTASDAYGDVAPFTNLTQVSAVYAPRDFFLGSSGTAGEVFGRVAQWENLLPWRWPHTIHELAGRPEIGLHVTYDTGLFVDPADQPLDTWFLSVSIEWPTGLRLETWNDMPNGTDFGPSYGIMLGFDLLTLWRSWER